MSEAFASEVALAVVSPVALRLLEPEELFGDVGAGPLATLLEKHAEARARVERVAATATVGGDLAASLPYFVRGNVEADRRSSAVDQATRLFAPERALKALDAESWQQALDLTDVLQVMPEKRREEWHESIRTFEVPAFDAATVAATIGDLLAQRRRFLAEKVDGVFRALSGEHVTNSSKGFGRRMIIHYVHNGWSADSHRSGYISDLRSVVAKFLGVEEPKWWSSRRVVEAGLRRHGEWLDVDGGALRVRVYKKGTAHLEVHPNVAWRLNAVLAELYPRAIAEEWRRRSARRDRTWREVRRPLPAQVLEILGDLYDADRRGRSWTVKWYSHSEVDTRALRREVGEVLELLGGVVSADASKVAFDYDAREVLDEVMVSGCVPDRAGMQHYPTPPGVAADAAELLAAEPGHVVLEPSAGLGALAEAVRARGASNLTCVELSAVHAAALRAKGFDPVVHGDFLNYRPARTFPGFHRVVMNPPFADGRWRAHLEHAASLVRPGGRLVAVLPASARGKVDLPGCEAAWGGTYENAFAGTGVAVSLLVVDRRG